MFVSIMPTVNGRKRHDFHHTQTLPVANLAEAAGLAVTDCLRKLRAEDITPDGDMIVLEIKFA